jgi:hypothetical protein
MIKKLFWLVVLLVVTACTVFLDGIGFPNTNPTPTVIPCDGCSPTPTQYLTETLVPIPTEISTGTVEPTATLLPTSTTEPTSTSNPTSTSTLIPPTKTFTPTAIPPTATFTVTPTKVPTSIATPVPTSTPTQFVELFNLQPTTPVFLINFVHEAEGCAWQGVAGQIFDKAGNPVKNYIVKVAGTFDGKPVNLMGITGMVAGNPYGPGSFEIVLGSKALDSIDKLTIQLFNPQAQAITNPLPFSTSSVCSKNLVIINFQEK